MVNGPSDILTFLEETLTTTVRKEAAVSAYALFFPACFSVLVNRTAFIKTSLADLITPVLTLWKL